ncbi:unnamed protein product [Rhizophagus irregularis]|nr:unnamed protein product [Rhizophagus irregularis]
MKVKNTKSQKQHKSHKTEMGTLAEEIETYGVNDLISFLEKQKGLDYDDAEIIRKEKINGHAFLKSTTKKLRDCGMPGGTAVILADFAKECKEKKSHAFSSHRTKKDLKEVLEKYGVGAGAGRIEDIPQFSPGIHKIDEKDESFLHCLKDIRIKLSNMGTVNQSNEAIRCEYISAILHACVHITKNLTGKYIRINPQFEIVGGKSTGRVDYAIGALEELFCITEGKQFQIDIGFAQNIMQCESAYRTNKRKQKVDDASYDYIFGIVTTATEWYFLLYTPDGISCTSRNPLSIHFVESALKEGSEEEKELYKRVKRVMEVIVGLLKDRVDVEKMPVVKKQRVCSYFEE